MSRSAFHQRYVVTTNVWSTRLGFELKLSHIHATVVTTATVGNRHMVFEIQDSSGNVLCDFHCGVNISASDTVHVEFIPGHDRETQLSGPNSDHIVVGIPILLIPGKYILAVKDEANVDVADTLEVNLWGEK